MAPQPNNATSLSTISAEELARNREVGINSIVFDPLTVLADQFFDAYRGDVIEQLPQSDFLDRNPAGDGWLATRSGAVMFLQPNARASYSEACALMFDFAAERIIFERLQTVRLYLGDLPRGPFVLMLDRAKSSMDALIA